jgi:hypothetical protein
VEQKGAALKSTLAAIEKLYGAPAHRDVIESLAEEVRAEIGGTVMSVRWYPVEIVAAVHVALRDRVGRGSWEASHAVGVEAARIDFTGVYRVFLRAVQYDTIWERMERAWSHYNSQGKLVWSERKEGSMSCQVTGVAGFNPGIWHAIAGRTQGLLLLSGAQSASCTPRDMTESSARIEGIWFD